jgi:hypothetical protein
VVVDTLTRMAPRYPKAAADALNLKNAID